jgi:hypothetical protein
MAVHWRFEKSLMVNVPEILPALLRTIDHNMATGKYESVRFDRRSSFGRFA